LKRTEQRERKKILIRMAIMMERKKKKIAQMLKIMALL
jgi:hypothetical protein